ncbi:ATP-dependent RNA helicase DBP10 [Armadillidium nasatum]|uniref:RNA helicase n=1 Tax=Armadillidium nasatum TaxID=96803 RepID=A0A5N5SLS8_9CRUS|nr:ATP-dependent RNA helicase DBP10 [Armadillidium nasatum]
MSVDGQEQQQETINETKASKSFKDLGVIDVLCDACERVGWKSPTAIQVESIPGALQGHDVIGLAETGSGKTGAFAIPILQNLLANPQRLFALVLTPTRELAYQIKEQFEGLGRACQVTCTVIVGGMDMKKQAEELRKKPHIVVGTPGRILDHLKKTKDFNFRSLKYLVMDEADRILEMDFEEEVNTIMGHLPRNKKCFLFSATMTSKVDKIQRPIYLAYLLYEIGKEKSVIIFCMTRTFTLQTTLLLRILGYNALPLFGKMDQNKRLGVLNKFKSKERSILLATDVASRGLDIPNVDYVINYNCPLQSKDYIHRVGRTARAGKEGAAITFVDQNTVLYFAKIEHDLDMKIPPFEVDEDDAMVFKENVLEACELAKKVRV